MVLSLNPLFSVNTPKILAEPYNKQKNFQEECVLCRGRMWDFTPITNEFAPYSFKINNERFFVHRGELKIVKMLEMTFQGKLVTVPYYRYCAADLSKNLHRFIDKFSYSEVGQYIFGSLGTRLNQRVDMLKRQYHLKSRIKLFSKFKGFDAIKFFQGVLYSPSLVNHQKSEVQDQVERNVSGLLTVEATPARRNVAGSQCAFCKGRVWESTVSNSNGFPYIIKVEGDERIFVHLIELKLAAIFKMTFKGRQIQLPSNCDMLSYRRHLHAKVSKLIHKLPLKNQGISSSGWSLFQRIKELQKKYFVQSNVEVFHKFEGKDAIEVFQEELYANVTRTASVNDSRLVTPGEKNFHLLFSAAELQWHIERLNKS